MDLGPAVAASVRNAWDKAVLVLTRKCRCSGIRPIGERRNVCRLHDCHYVSLQGGAQLALYHFAWLAGNPYPWKTYAMLRDN